MKPSLNDLMSDPMFMAEMAKRACGDAGFPLGPPVSLRPVSEKWPVKQVQNNKAATMERTRAKPEKKPSGR